MAPRTTPAIAIPFPLVSPAVTIPTIPKTREAIPNHRGKTNNEIIPRIIEINPHTLRLLLFNFNYPPNQNYIVSLYNQ